MSGQAETTKAAREAGRSSYLADQGRGLDPAWNMPPGYYRSHGPVTAHLAPEGVPPMPFLHDPMASSPTLRKG